MAKVNDFARELSEKYGLSLGDASDFVSAMFDVVKEELDGADSSVKIKGFGTFKVSAVGARASVDVNTGERIIIDGRNKISFTPEVLLRDRVNRPFVQFETVVLNVASTFLRLMRKARKNLILYQKRNLRGCSCPQLYQPVSQQIIILPLKQHQRL